MNIALIIAGGVGTRMGNVVPKQFLKVNGKPVLVYTLEKFQNHSQVDAIAVVCLKGWEEDVWVYKDEYNIGKLLHVFSGGENGQQSIENGVFSLEKLYPADTMILMHEAVRPLVTEQIITDCINTAKQFGNATAAIPSVDTIMHTLDGKQSSEVIVREEVRKTQVPQAFTLQYMCSLYREAAQQGITNSATTCILSAQLGKTVFFSPGSTLNFKLTTADDMKLFQAILDTQL